MPKNLSGFFFRFEQLLHRPNWRAATKGYGKECLSDKFVGEKIISVETTFGSGPSLHEDEKETWGAPALTLPLCGALAGPLCA